MKKIIVLLIILLTLLPAGAKTLTGGVVYTVETAREAAFEDIEYEISMEPFKKYMTDPGFISAAKSEGGRPRVSKKGRRVVLFSRGEYGIRYNNNPIYDYYYNECGKLIALGIFGKNSHREYKYPRLYIKYEMTGRIESVTYYTSSDESFTYDRNKLLIVHWKDNKGFDVNGKLVNKRKY